MRRIPRILRRRDGTVNYPLIVLLLILFGGPAGTLIGARYLVVDEDSGCRILVIDRGASTVAARLAADRWNEGRVDSIWLNASRMNSLEDEFIKLGVREPWQQECEDSIRARAPDAVIVVLDPDSCTGAWSNASAALDRLARSPGRCALVLAPYFQGRRLQYTFDHAPTVLADEERSRVHVLSVSKGIDLSNWWKEPTDGLEIVGTSWLGLIEARFRPGDPPVPPPPKSIEGYMNEFRQSWLEGS